MIVQIKVWNLVISERMENAKLPEKRTLKIQNHNLQLYAKSLAYFVKIHFEKIFSQSNPNFPLFKPAYTEHINKCVEFWNTHGL